MPPCRELAPDANLPLRSAVVVGLSLHHDVYMPMTRTQVSFEREMLRRARSRAGELGLSLAAYVRHLVADDLAREAPSGDPTTVFNLGASGGSDIASDKAAMLGDAFSRSEG
jgi:hypothetical protein